MEPANPAGEFKPCVTATQVVPVARQHGWTLGRIFDPCGHHWEIGRPDE